jgi:hypothetical protein
MGRVVAVSNTTAKIKFRGEQIPFRSFFASIMTHQTCHQLRIEIFANYWLREAELKICDFLMRVHATGDDKSGQGHNLQPIK